MNYLYYSVEEEFQECEIEINDKKLKFEIAFNYEIDKELEKITKELEEFNELNNKDSNKDLNNDDNEEEEDDYNIYQKNLIIQVKLFKTLNEEYLLRIRKISGELFDFYQKFEKINTFIDNYL